MHDVAGVPGVEALLLNCCAPQAVTAGLAQLAGALPAGLKVGGYANGFQTTTSEWLSGASQPAFSALSGNIPSMARYVVSPVHGWQARGAYCTATVACRLSDMLCLAAALCCCRGLCGRPDNARGVCTACVGVGQERRGDSGRVLRHWTRAHSCPQQCPAQPVAPGGGRRCYGEVRWAFTKGRLGV